MGYMSRGRSSDGSARASAEAHRPGPGKQTRVELIDAQAPGRPSPGAAMASAPGRGHAEAPSASGGKALPDDVRARMEAALGADFSAVRIHEGPQASALGALACTQGTDIYFAPGQYDPVSPHGQELLGHELAHVVQQAQGRVPVTAQARGAAWNADAALEHEADVLGGRAARGETARTGAAVTPTARSVHAPVQARLPQQNYEYQVRTGEPQHANSNLQGLQNLLVRIYTQELLPQEQKQLQTECSTHDIQLLAALYGAPSEHTQHVYNWMCTLFPRLCYPGHDVSREPTEEHERTNRTTLIKHVRTVLAWMCGSESDAAFRSVFGLDHVVRARERAVKAKDWAESEHFAKSLGVDRTGESDEMMIGAHATFQSAITLRPQAFAQPPGGDLIATVTHEVFHAANQDVLDNGGYPSAREDFMGRSGDQKILNASHYEEVARRFLNASPVGGDFIPVVRHERSEDGTLQQVDDRTPIQRAMNRVRDTVQIAWERGQNVHGFLKASVHQTYDVEHIDEHLRTDVLLPALTWSRILRLQLHDRFAETGQKRLVINYIDLLQVETITKSLGQMMGRDLAPLLHETPTKAQNALDLSDEDFANLIAKYLLDALVSKYADARWLKPDDFVAMIEKLQASPRDVRRVQLL